MPSLTLRERATIVGIAEARRIFDTYGSASLTNLVAMAQCSAGTGVTLWQWQGKSNKARIALAERAAEVEVRALYEAREEELRCGYCTRGIYPGTNGPEVCPYCDGAGVTVPCCGVTAGEFECDEPARFRAPGILGTRWRCATHGNQSEEVYPRTAEAQALWDAT